MQIVRKEILLSCRYHDCLCRKLKSSKKTPRSNKWVQQGGRIHDKHTKINCVAVYEQWTHRHKNLQLLKKIKYIDVNLTRGVKLV